MEKTFLAWRLFGSQDIDGPALSKATVCPVRKLYNCLCTDQTALPTEAMARSDTVDCLPARSAPLEELAAGDLSHNAEFRRYPVNRARLA